MAKKQIQRLDKMLAKARAMATERGRAVHRRRLRGADWGAVMDALVAATPPDQIPLLDDIGDQTRDFAGRTLSESERECPEDHGFLTWLAMVQFGVFDIPDVIPAEVLLAWRDRYAEENKWGIYQSARADADAAYWGEVAKMNPQCGYVTNYARRREENHRCNVRVRERCRDCHLGLPPRPASAGPAQWPTCPVCGSTRLDGPGVWAKDLRRALDREEAMLAAEGAKGAHPRS